MRVQGNLSANEKETLAQKTFSSVEDIRTYSRKQKAKGRKVALVPTMGALHDGHLSLVRLGLQKADRVIVSIFVNPKQFGPNEDLDAYPRQLEQDRALLQGEGCHAIFHPYVEEMYPQGFDTNIHVSGVSEGLCGQDRPGHFDGVATVVAKLLIQCEPHVAIFGEKDYQQLCLIKKLTADLNIPVEIMGGAIIRDEEGLALSSRNKYLSEGEKQTARHINKILAEGKILLEEGAQWQDAVTKMTTRFHEQNIKDIDYLELRAEETLNSLTLANQKCRILTAVRVGKARLIDNIVIKPD